MAHVTLLVAEGGENPGLIWPERASVEVHACASFYCYKPILKHTIQIAVEQGQFLRRKSNLVEVAHPHAEK
jgi:hypothetical protein